LRGASVAQPPARTVTAPITIRRNARRISEPEGIKLEGFKLTGLPFKPDRRSNLAEQGMFRDISIAADHKPSRLHLRY
jgi:hypothetical protein